MNAADSKAPIVSAETIETNEPVASNVCLAGQVSSGDLCDLVADASIVGPALIDQLDVSRMQDSSGGSVSVELQATGIALQVRTHLPTHSQILDLAARLDFATQQLNLAQQNLHGAFTRIGFLEAQLQQRDELINYLSRSQSNASEP